MITADFIENTACTVENGSNYVQDHLPINDFNLDTFKIEAKWEGLVTAIEKGIVYAELIEAGSAEVDEAEIPVKLISNDDMELLEEGALFYLYAGYHSKNGTKRRGQIIKFRRKVMDTNSINRILDTMKSMDLESLIKKY